MLELGYKYILSKKGLYDPTLFNVKIKMSRPKFKNKLKLFPFTPSCYI